MKRDMATNDLDIYDLSTLQENMSCQEACAIPSDPNSPAVSIYKKEFPSAVKKGHSGGEVSDLLLIHGP